MHQAYLAVFLLLATALSGPLAIANEESQSQACVLSGDNQEIEAAGTQKKTKVSVQSATKKFNAFLDAIGSRLLERDYIIEQISVALLAKEHFLMVGPPGNAKSMVSDLIFSNIVESNGDTSLYKIQMTPETTIQETHGPFDPKKVFDSGRLERHYDEGMLFAKLGFIDEIFDGRSNARRNILGLLAERQHAQGTKIVDGKIETVIGATNKYIDQVYELDGNDGPKALLDRFSITAFVPGEFENASSYLTLIQMANNKANPIPQITFDELDTLRTLTKQVVIPESVAQMLSMVSYRLRAETEAIEASSLKTYKKKLRNGEDPAPPYRATKYHSPRTVFKAAKILSAMIVQDYIRSGGKRSLRADFSDIKKLVNFFTLNGPETNFVKAMLERTMNPYERSQLSAILQERELFDQIYSEIFNEANEVLYNHAATDLGDVTRMSKTQTAKKTVYKKIIRAMAEVKLELGTAAEEDIKQTDMSGRIIGKYAVLDFLDDLLEDNFSADEVTKAKSEVEDATKKIIAEHKAKIKKEREEAEARQKEFEDLTTRKTLLQGQLEEQSGDLKNAFKNGGLTGHSLTTNSADVNEFVAKWDDDHWIAWSPSSNDLYMLSNEGGQERISNRDDAQTGQVLNQQMGNISGIYKRDESTVGIIVGNQVFELDVDDKTIMGQFRLDKRDNFFTYVDHEQERLILIDFKESKFNTIDFQKNKGKWNDFKTTANGSSANISDHFTTFDRFHIDGDNIVAEIAGRKIALSLDLKSKEAVVIYYSDLGIPKFQNGADELLSTGLVGNKLWFHEIYGEKVYMHEIDASTMKHNRSVELDVKTNAYSVEVAHDNSVFIVGTNEKGFKTFSTAGGDSIAKSSFQSGDHGRHIRWAKDNQFFISVHDNGKWHLRLIDLDTIEFPEATQKLRDEITEVDKRLAELSKVGATLTDSSSEETNPEEEQEENQ